MWALVAVAQAAEEGWGESRLRGQDGGLRRGRWPRWRGRPRSSEIRVPWEGLGK